MEGHKETENIEDLYYSQLVAAADEWESQFSLEDRLKLFNQQYMTSKEEVLHKLDLHIKYIERGVTNGDDDPTYATTMINFLSQFKEKVEKTTLFNSLEDWWSYEYSLSSRGAVLYLVHTRGATVDFNKRISGRHDTTMNIIEFPAKILTVEEYAESIGVKSGTVRQWIRRAKIRSAFKQGQEWRIPELSRPVKRGYFHTRYVWTVKLTDVPKGYEYLSKPSGVSIYQDTYRQFRFPGEYYYPKPAYQTFVQHACRLHSLVSGGKCHLIPKKIPGQLKRTRLPYRLLN